MFERRIGDGLVPKVDVRVVAVRFTSLGQDPFDMDLYFFTAFEVGHRNGDFGEPFLIPFDHS